MPALKEEYDYYEYASRRRQGTVKNAVPSSAVHKKVSNNSAASNKRSTASTTHRTDGKTATTSRVATSSKSRSTVNSSRTTVNSNNKNSRTQNKNLNLKTTTTRDVTKNATRIATRDDAFIGSKKKTTTTTTRKKQTSKNIDPVVFNNKKTIKKPQEMILTRPKSNVKSKSVAKQKARVKEMFKNVVVASLVFGMLFLICYRYSDINEAFNELNDLKSELKDKQTVNAQIESNIKQNTDLAYIENYAKYQLGMQKPKDSQIQKVSIQKQDKIILPVEIEEEEEKGFFENLFDSVLNTIN